MKVVADTGPLVAAANDRDRHHALAGSIVEGLSRDLVVPVPVLTEVEHLLRWQAGGHIARRFMRSVADGDISVGYLTPGLLRRAVAFDETYADLGLGLADCSVMAMAERRRLPILTFDFKDFRATKPKRGYWRLIIDEARFRDSVG